MMARFGDGRDWFFEKRYGMFVHWGLYSVPGWHEQHQWRRPVRRKVYARLIHEFDPAGFDPNRWLDMAEEAGMQFVCLTSKHHDGFCLWDTSQTPYGVMKSPYGRDIVGMVAGACHRRGFPLCLYYSIVDWHHPNYPNQNRSHELPGPEDGDGDYVTSEREFDALGDEALRFSRPTQGCNSVGTESWGYREDEDYYADRHLMESLDEFLAKGGSYLLNVGPTADGAIPEDGGRVLRALGRWYRDVAESFDRAEPASGLVENRDVLLTRKGNILYVHLFKQPVQLPSFSNL